MTRYGETVDELIARGASDDEIIDRKRELDAIEPQAVTEMEADQILGIVREYMALSHYHRDRAASFRAIPS